MAEKIAIIAGGELDEGFLLPFIEQEQFGYVIAVDGALAFTAQWNIPIQAAVGDFDTVSESVLAQYVHQDGLYIERHQPEKNQTDTELALQIAMKRQPESITILGGTGGRLDHFLGNLQILLQPLKAGIPCAMVDACNRLMLHKRSFVVCQDTQFGTYVSLIPFTRAVRNLTLEGFRYPVQHMALVQGNSLGISNEVSEKIGRVTFDEGILICIESRDRKKHTSVS